MGEQTSEEKGKIKDLFYNRATQRLAEISPSLERLEHLVAGEGELQKQLADHRQFLLDRLQTIQNELDSFDWKGRGTKVDADKKALMERVNTLIDETIPAFVKAVEVLEKDEAEAKRLFEEMKSAGEPRVRRISAKPEAKKPEPSKAPAVIQPPSEPETARTQPRVVRARPKRGPELDVPPRAAATTGDTFDDSRESENDPAIGTHLYLMPTEKRRSFVEVRFVGADPKHPRKVLVKFSEKDEPESFFRDKLQLEKPQAGSKVRTAFVDSEYYTNPLEKLGLKEDQLVYVTDRRGHIREVKVVSVEGKKVWYWTGYKKGDEKEIEWGFGDTIQTDTPEKFRKFREVELAPFKEDQVIYLKRKRGEKIVYEEVKFGEQTSEDESSVYFGDSFETGKRFTVSWRDLVTVLPVGETPISQDPKSQYYESKESKFKPGEVVYNTPKISGKDEHGKTREGRVEKVEGNTVYVWFGKKIINPESGAVEKDLRSIPQRGLFKEKPDGDFTPFIEDPFAFEQQVYIPPSSEGEGYLPVFFLGMGVQGAKYRAGKDAKTGIVSHIDISHLVDKVPDGAKIVSAETPRPASKPSESPKAEEPAETRESAAKPKLIYLKTGDIVMRKDKEHRVLIDPEIQGGKVVRIQLVRLEGSSSQFALTSDESINALLENLPPATRAALLEREKDAVAQVADTGTQKPSDDRQEDDRSRVERPAQINIRKKGEAFRVEGRDFKIGQNVFISIDGVEYGAEIYEYAPSSETVYLRYKKVQQVLGRDVIDDKTLSIGKSELHLIKTESAQRAQAHAVENKEQLSPEVKFAGDPVENGIYIVSGIPLRIHSIDKEAQPPLLTYFNLRYALLVPLRQRDWDIMVGGEKLERAKTQDFVLQNKGDKFGTRGRLYEIGQELIDTDNHDERVVIVRYIMGPNTEDQALIVQKISDNTEYKVADPSTLQELPVASKFEHEPVKGEAYMLGNLPIFVVGFDITPGSPKIQIVNLRFEEMTGFTPTEWKQYLNKRNLRKAQVADLILDEADEEFIHRGQEFKIGQELIDEGNGNERVSVHQFIMGPKLNDREIVLEKISDGSMYRIKESLTLRELTDEDEEAESEEEPAANASGPENPEARRDAPPPPPGGSEERRETEEEPQMSVQEICAEFLDEAQLRDLVGRFTHASLIEDEHSLATIQTEIQNIFDVRTLSDEDRLRVEDLAKARGYDTIEEFVEAWRESGWKVLYNVLDGMVAHDLLGKINGNAELQALLAEEAAHEKQEYEKHGKGIKGWFSRVVSHATIPAGIGFATAGLVAWLTGGAAMPVAAGIGAGAGTLTQRVLDRLGFFKKREKRNQKRNAILAKIHDDVIASQEKVGANRFRAILAETLTADRKPSPEAQVHREALSHLIADLDVQIAVLRRDLAITPDADKESQLLELQRQRVVYIADQTLLIQKQNNPAIAYNKKAQVATNKSAYFKTVWSMATHGVDGGWLHGQKWNLYSTEQKRVWMGHLAAMLLNGATAGVVVTALPGLSGWARALVRGAAAFVVKGGEAALHERSRIEGKMRDKIREAQILLSKGDKDSVYEAEAIFREAFKTANNKDILTAGLKTGGIAAGVGVGVGAAADGLRAGVGAIQDAYIDRFGTPLDQSVKATMKAGEVPAVEKHFIRSESKGFGVGIPAAAFAEESHYLEADKAPVAGGEETAATTKPEFTAKFEKEIERIGSKAPESLELPAAKYIAKTGDGFNNLLNSWQKDPNLKEQIIDSLRNTKKDWLAAAENRGRALGFGKTKLDEFVNDRLIHNWRLSVDKNLGVIIPGDNKEWQYTRDLYPGDIGTLRFDPVEGPVVEVTRANGSALETHRPYTLGKNATAEVLPESKPTAPIVDAGARIPIVQTSTELHTANPDLFMYPNPDGNGFNVEFPNGTVLENMIIEGKNLVPRSSVEQAIAPAAAGIGGGKDEIVKVAPRSRLALPEEKPDNAPLKRPPEKVQTEAQVTFEEAKDIGKTFEQIADTSISKSQRVDLLRSVVPEKGSIQYGALQFTEGLGGTPYIRIGTENVFITEDNIDAAAKLADLSRTQSLAAKNATEIRALRDELLGRGEQEAPVPSRPENTNPIVNPEWKVQWPTGLTDWMDSTMNREQGSLPDNYSPDQVERIIEKLKQLDSEVEQAHKSSAMLAQAKVVQNLEDFKNTVESGKFK